MDSQESETGLFHTVVIYEDGRGSALHFLKSKMSSFVFLVVCYGLFVQHCCVRLWISSHKADLPLTEMSPTAVVPSANLIMEVEVEVWTGQ